MLDLYAIPKYPISVIEETGTMAVVPSNTALVSVNPPVATLTAPVVVASAVNRGSTATWTAAGLRLQIGVIKD